MIFRRRHLPVTCHPQAGSVGSVRELLKRSELRRLQQSPSTPSSTTSCWAHKNTRTLRRQANSCQALGNTHPVCVGRLGDVEPSRTYVAERALHLVNFFWRRSADGAPRVLVLTRAGLAAVSDHASASSPVYLLAFLGLCPEGHMSAPRTLWGMWEQSMEKKEAGCAFTRRYRALLARPIGRQALGTRSAAQATQPGRIAAHPGSQLAWRPRQRLSRCVCALRYTGALTAEWPRSCCAPAPW